MRAWIWMVLQAQQAGLTNFALGFGFRGRGGAY